MSMSNSEEMDDAFSNMIQQIALIEHQNREVVQKYREIEHKIMDTIQGRSGISKFNLPCFVLHPKESQSLLICYT